MDFQHWFEAAVALLFTIFGWVLNTLWSANKDLSNKVQQIELLVAGQYMKKDAFEKFMEAIFYKLDKIEDKIDKKVDK